MRKINLTLITIVFTINFSYAQWTGGSTGPIYYNGGSVGIGTTNPATTLDVNGTGNFSGGVSTGLLTNSSNVFQQVLSSSYYGVLGTSWPGQFRWYASPNNSLYKNNALYQLRAWDVGSNTENNVLTLTGAGDLTARSLNVYGLSVTSQASQTNLSAFNNNGIHINGNVSNVAQDAITYTSGGGGGAAIGFGRGGSYDTYMAFYTNSGSNLVWQGISEAVRISSSGFVSIGTTDSQGYMLAVNGNAIATSMTVKLHTAWPDYVFKPAYHLTTLTEIKAYIDVNHHLPDMPSEQEVAKNGINLGEMNKLLVKKIEELTLYLIEQQQQTEQLKQQQKLTNQTQQEQINQLKEQVTIITKALNQQVKKPDGKTNR